MPDRSDFSRLVAFLQDPVMLVTARGRVEVANDAAKRLFGTDVVGSELAPRTKAPQDFLRYLVRCSGSNRPTIGSAILRLADGEERKLQLEGGLFRAGEAGSARLIVRCRPRGAEEFSVLGRKMAELQAEIRHRRRVQAELEESLAQKDMLLRELQHRTKNHTQMLLGMFSSLASGARSDEAREVLQTALARLRAIGAAQQLMYEVERLDTVPAAMLVRGVCEAIAETWPSEIELSVDTEDAPLPNDVAVPVALILNEFLSNALKHGLRYGRGRVAVDFHRADRDLVLSVWDSGAGLGPASGERRSSGLSIVRGLCRQIGGLFEIAGDDGMRATVRFPNPEHRIRSDLH